MRWNQTKVGLKGSSPNPCKLVSSVEIRPRWDWKRLYLCQLCVLQTVEIRPRWDWKQSFDATKFLTTLICWNQTKVGLKGLQTGSSPWAFPRSWNQTKVGLKGIKQTRWVRQKLQMLKSDQGGIESGVREGLECWGVNRWNQTKVGLKEFFSIWSHVWQLRKLKSDQGGIERCFSSGMNGRKSYICWNQTKVGLKAPWVQGTLCSRPWVEIRPRWDWKRYVTESVMKAIETLKSDQGGIESWKSTAQMTAWRLLLKSDQGGIERVLKNSWLVC